MSSNFGAEGIIFIGAGVYRDGNSVTMETAKPQSVSALLYGGSVAVPTERKMDAQTPLTAVYIQAVPAPPPPQQLFPQAQFPVTPPREPVALHLPVSPLYTKDTLPFLTVHFAGRLQPLRPELSRGTTVSLAPVAPVGPVTRPKSAGKHVCPHCSRDCMKPSVLEKHLRCHTGERPYHCTTCRVSFKTQSNLYKHKRTQAHARLSSEWEQSPNSSMGSQGSLCGSSVCSSSLDSQVEEESGSLEEDVFTLPKYHCGEKPMTDPERGLAGDPVQGNIDLSSATQKTEPVQRPGLTKEEVKGREGETAKLQGVMPNRHLPLQRQQATQFFQEWEGSASRGKPQSYESTDSGFSESTDHNMEPLPECITEHREGPGGSQAVTAGLSQKGPDSRDSVSVREQRSLEEHISKLISDNSVVVEDKQLENMRPRKTMLSKQGSIDLPMPYTYKDSFHFDMRNNPTSITRLHGNTGNRPVLQRSLQPPHSVSTEQAPLTRSSSLPYSVALLTPEQSNQSFSCRSDYVTLIPRGSSGPVNPTAFSGQSVDQQVSAHRPLVRQAAVDCNHATEGLLFANSLSLERPPMNNDLSCEGGGGGDTCGEPSDRKRPRKKAQKFTYNKWYAYKGGTFKKLYNTTKGGDSMTAAAKEPSPSSMEHSAAQSVTQLPGGHSEGTTAASTTSEVTVYHSSCLPTHPSPVSGMELNLKSRRVHQARSSPRPPPLSHASTSRSPENHRTDIIRGPAERLTSKESHTDSLSPTKRAHIPSDWKKLRTNDSTGVVNPPRREAGCSTLNEPSSLVADGFHTHNTNVGRVSLHLDQRVDQHGGGRLPQCIAASNEQTSVKPPTSVSLVSSTKTSFLPKYQLKLPATTQTKSIPPPHTMNMSKRNDGHSFMQSVSSPSDNQLYSPAIGNSTSSGHECTVQPHMLPGNPQSTWETISTQTVSKCESLVTGVNHGVTPALAVSQRHCTTLTTATATMRSHQKEFCYPTVIQTSPFKPVMALHAKGLSRPALQDQSIMTFTAGRQNSQTTSLSSSATTSSQGLRPNLSHPLCTRPSLSQLNRASTLSVGHTVPDPPFQMLPFNPGQLNPVQKVFHVQTADLQICLQIISDEQLALFEPRMEKQATTSDSRRKTQAQELYSSVNIAGASENLVHQSMCDQKEVDNMEPSHSPEPHYMKWKPMGQASASQAQVSGNTTVSWSIQPPVHPHSDATHNTAADQGCGTAGIIPTEALSKAVKPDARKTRGESGHSFSAGLAAEERGEVTPLFPGELLQEESQGSQHTHPSQRATPFTLEEVAAKPNEQVCAPTTSQGGEARPLPQRDRTRAWTRADTIHVIPHPGDGSSPNPDNNTKLCNASGEVNTDPSVCCGVDGDDLVDPEPGHSDTRLQPLRRGDAGLRSPDVPLVHSASSHHTALWDSDGRPQPLGPTHGGLTCQGAPESQGRPPGQPDSAGPGQAQRNPGPWKNQQCVAEVGENAQVEAPAVPGPPVLPRSQTQRGMSAGPAAVAAAVGAGPADGTSLSRLTPAGGEVVLPRLSGVDLSGRQRVCDRLQVSCTEVRHQPQGCLRQTNDHEDHVCHSDTKPRHAHADATKSQDVTSEPAGARPAACTRDTASTVTIHTTTATCSSDAPVSCSPPWCCPTTQRLEALKSAMKTSPCPPHLPETPRPALPTQDPNNSNSSSAWKEDEVHISMSCTELSSTAEVEGGGETQAHTAFCGDPVGGEGEGFPSSSSSSSSRYQYHPEEEVVVEEKEEEEVVLTEAQLGGQQFTTEGSSTTNVGPMLPNCQGYQEGSSSDDDDEGKLIIEL